MQRAASPALAATATSFTGPAGRAFSIGEMRTELFADPATVAESFAAERAIVCRDIFEAGMLDRLVAAARDTQFRDDHVAGLGTRAVEEPQRVGGVVNLLLRRSNLLRWLELVSGRSDLAGVDGRLVQTRAGGGDALDWHNDLQGPRRALGITICFGDTPYSGGLFEMRRVGDPSSTRVFDHSQPGTALIFDIGSDLEHRVLPVTCGGPRRVFTGWFMRAHALPSLLD